jgi:hypothetical protein
VVEDAHHVVELGLLCFDFPDGKLGLSLHKPGFNVLGPDLWELESNVVDFFAHVAGHQCGVLVRKK